MATIREIAEKWAERMVEKRGVMFHENKEMLELALREYGELCAKECEDAGSGHIHPRDAGCHRIDAARIRAMGEK